METERGKRNTSSYIWDSRPFQTIDTLLTVDPADQAVHLHGQARQGRTARWRVVRLGEVNTFTELCQFYRPTEYIQALVDNYYCYLLLIFSCCFFVFFYYFMLYVV